VIPLGRWAGDPRITRTTDDGIAAGDDWIVCTGSQYVAERDGVQSNHEAADEALYHLLGEPMSRLTWALLDALPDPARREDLRRCCAWFATGEDTAWDILAAALAASLTPTGPAT
jgi:hypothetical protein